MAETSFESRARAAGLRSFPNDTAKLEALVKDLDRAAASLRGPRHYAQEPTTVFRLQPAATSR
ncbi:MAG TPA: hypothetical protein PLD10_06520 [Rhodopila sp.]|nr:hypothetical protein [Rhodopila sp.]